jgi:hypothetical protein
VEGNWKAEEPEQNYPNYTLLVLLKSLISSLNKFALDNKVIKNGSFLDEKQTLKD